MTACYAIISETNLHCSHLAALSASVASACAASKPIIAAIHSVAVLKGEQHPMQRSEKAAKSISRMLLLLLLLLKTINCCSVSLSDKFTMPVIVRQCCTCQSTSSSFRGVSLHRHPRTDVRSCGKTRRFTLKSLKCQTSAEDIG